jgi:hypothetical protein
LSLSSASTSSVIALATKAVIKVLSLNQGLEESLFSMSSYGSIQPSLGQATSSSSSSFNVIGTIVPLSSDFSSFIFHNNSSLILNTLEGRLYKAVKGSNQLSTQMNILLNEASLSSSVAITYNVTVEDAEMNLLRVLIIGTPSVAPSPFSPAFQPKIDPLPSAPASSSVSTSSSDTLLLSNTSLALIIVFSCIMLFFIVVMIGYGWKMYRAHREAILQNVSLPPTRPSSTILSRSTVPSSRHYSLPFHFRRQEDEKIQEENNYHISL